MYSNYLQIISDQLADPELTAFTARASRQFHVHSHDEDIRQDIFLSMCEHGIRNPGFAESVCHWSPERLRAYLATAIQNAVYGHRRSADTERGRLLGLAEERLVQGRAGPVDPIVADPGDGAKAVRVVRQVYAELDEKGRIAFAVIMRGTSPERVASDFGVCERTGRRWFTEGLPLLRKAIDRVLRAEFGDQAFGEFARLAAAALMMPETRAKIFSPGLQEGTDSPRRSSRLPPTRQ